MNYRVRIFSSPNWVAAPLLGVALMSSRLGADPGTVDPTFNPGTGANNSVVGVALRQDGKVVIAGSFTSFNGTNRAQVALLGADGALDPSFDPGAGPGSGVEGVAVQPDGKVLISGTFSVVNGTTRLAIARLNTDGGVDFGFDAGAFANNPVHRMVVLSSGSLLVGGFFAGGMARLDPNGGFDASFNPGNGANDGVYSFVSTANGSIVIGGAFTVFNRTNRNFIARLTAQGALDLTFNPGTGANAIVLAVAAQPDGKVLLVGDFTSVNGTNRNRIARLNADGSVDTTFDPGAGADAAIFSMALDQDGKVLLGGDFTHIDGANRNHIARLNPDGTLDQSFDPGTGATGRVNAIVVQPDGAVILGGSFVSVNGIARRRIARLGTPYLPKTFIVTNSNDSGAGSLRQAILDANARASSNQIVFNIAPGGPQTISPLSGLPAISNSINLDATTQPGFAGAPIIEINGVNAGAVAGLTLSKPSLLRGFVVNNFKSQGLILSGTDCRVEGNYIGTDITGMIARTNGGFGIWLRGTNNVIGGANAAARNIISASSANGIAIFGRSNVVTGNLVGTDATGLNPIGNSGFGIVIPTPQGGFNRVGGSEPGAGNVIAFNGLGGIGVLNTPVGASNNLIRANAIFSNSGLGIDLGNTGLTPNDLGDNDTGGNLLQNFPILTLAANSGPNILIQGTLNTSPNSACQIDFYANAQCEPSGYGEGEAYLGATTVTTDGSGNAAFSLTLPSTAPAGGFVTATATDSANNTSEFSACQLITGTSPAVVLALTSNSSGRAICWPSAAAGYMLEYAENLTRPIQWQLVTDGIRSDGVVKSYPIPITSDLKTTSRFYQLRYP